jgi:hypothetical protein
VATNNFDALLEDLEAVQKLKDAGRLMKALDAADAVIGAPVTKLRAAKARIDQARVVQHQRPKPGPALREIRPATSRAPTKSELRRRFSEQAPKILAKALALQADGQVTATQVAAVEAAIHRIGAGL